MKMTGKRPEAGVKLVAQSDWRRDKSDFCVVDSRGYKEYLFGAKAL